MKHRVYISNTMPHCANMANLGVLIEDSEIGEFKLNYYIQI